jgi:O-methyltransferase
VRSGRHFADGSEPLWHVDVVNADTVSGWALAPTGAEWRIEVRVDGRRVGDAVRGMPRPDVALAHPHRPRAAESGFAYGFGAGDFARVAASHADVEVCLVGPWAPRSHLTRVPLVTVGDRQALTRGPFAAPVLVLLQEINPGYDTSDWNDAVMLAAVEDIAYLTHSGSKRLKGLYPYLSYLAACQQHARLVERNFPRTNAGRRPLDKDGQTVQCSGLEMVAIAHHLWVLASHGVQGALLEFGCFKGFSTSVLSYACGLLGRQMYVFDSFAGLPPSSDGYYQAGDFAGSYEEVVSNVTEFGCASAVRFHKGFFAESVPRWSPEPAALLWLDVDLESSARDALRVFSCLSRGGSVFSHECVPTSFRDGRPAPVPGPANVVQPIVDAFVSTGLKPRGRFIAGNTGAFWDDGQGLPILSREALEALGTVAQSLCG